jgi:hypothetical protein
MTPTPLVQVCLCRSCLLPRVHRHRVHTQSVRHTQSGRPSRGGCAGSGCAHHRGHRAGKKGRRRRRRQLPHLKTGTCTAALFRAASISARRAAHTVRPTQSAEQLRRWAAAEASPAPWPAAHDRHDRQTDRQTDSSTVCVRATLRARRMGSGLRTGAICRRRQQHTLHP